MKKEIGLFFGSFNPIHIGHLIIAQQILQAAKLHEVWFVVSPQNPLKQKESLLAERQRLHLVRLAIDDNPKFRASDVEFGLPKPSYTIDTLRFLQKKFPSRNFALILGEDNLSTLHLWKDYRELLAQKILVYKRAGAESCELHTHSNVFLFDFPVLNISASYVRKSIENNMDVRYLLHESVWVYIKANALYLK